MNEVKPSYLRTRKEALAAGLVWGLFGIWTVTVSYLMGYLYVDYSTVMGFPKWVFWGILVPWFAALLVNTFYSLFYLKDEERDETH